MSIIYTDKDGIDHKSAGKEVPGIASDTEFGVVQFTDSTGVTSNDGLALSATEKNKDIPGSLASDINDLEAKMGDTPIGIGDATVTGAISALNTKLSGVLGVTNSRYELNVQQEITAGTEYNIGTSPQLSNGTIIGIIIRNLSNITSIPIVYTGGNGTPVWARFSSNMPASTRKIIVDYIYIVA